MAFTKWTPIADKRSAVGVGAAADTFGSGATDGMNLDSVHGFAVEVEAAEGQLVTTAPALLAYWQNPYTKRWSRAEDWDIPAGTAKDVRSLFLRSFTGVFPGGRVGYAFAAGAVDGGDVTIRITAISPRGELL